MPIVLALLPRVRTGGRVDESAQRRPSVSVAVPPPRTREDYRHTVQSNLDAIDKKLVDLDARARKGKRIDADMNVLRSQRDAFARDARHIDTATALTWDDTKARIDKEWDDLKAAVDRAH